ncbi:hypothetical protein, partial [Streptomyces sp. NPDC058424]|uniref:hypothetical protein n=1 Tax=Streptomyces sp. NPDC058424 TaxID=3346491 RepID=UPI0036678CB8
MLRQVPFHPVHQVGFIEEMSIHGEQPQHDQAKVARDFGSSADGVALATSTFDTRSIRTRMSGSGGPAPPVPWPTRA